MMRAKTHLPHTIKMTVPRNSLFRCTLSVQYYKRTITSLPDMMLLIIWFHVILIGGIPIDTNNAGLVQVYLGDIVEHLPYNEQLHWKKLQRAT